MQDFANTPTECETHNKEVFSGLQCLFELLAKENALVGRDDARIVFDLRKTPLFVSSSMSAIFSGAYLVAPSAMARLFGGYFQDDDAGVCFFNIRSIVASKKEHSIDPLFLDKFAYIDEIVALINGIPRLSQEQSDAFERIETQISQETAQILSEHAPEIIDALFGRAPSDFVAHNPDVRVLN